MLREAKGGLSQNGNVFSRIGLFPWRDNIRFLELNY